MPEPLKFVSVDQLPEEPLRMPPPYWRSGGAWFQLDDALQELVERLHDLVPVHAEVEAQIETHFEKYPSEEESESEAAMDEFGNICDPLWEAEHNVKLKCDLSTLMAPILAEEIINRFCVYNLPKELVESLEKLSPVDKFTAAASHLGKSRVRGTVASAAMTGLSGWRNAFAHGHCVDRPVKTLRHNHLIPPEAYPGVPDSVASVIKHTQGFIGLVTYLASISANEFTATPDEASAFRPHLDELKRFKIKGDANVYEIVPPSRDV